MQHRVSETKNDQRKFSDKTFTGSSNLKANIALTGLMGSGKTSVGELLARNLGFGFIDLDSWIAHSEGTSIADMFTKHGESHFRQLEKDAIASFSNMRNQVIAVGGGAVVDDENSDRLRDIATVIWLKTPPVEIARRIVMSPDEIRRRPLIADLVAIEERMDRQKQIEQRLAALELQRQRQYEKADLVVEFAYATQETCAHFLANQILRLNPAKAASVH